ncbi:MAG: SLC13 family permease [Eubacteriales bacterium]
MSKEYIHVMIAVLLGFVLKIFLPASNGLTEIGVNTLTVLVPTVYLWLTVTTGWTTLFAMAGLVIAGVITDSEVWSGVLAARACIIIAVCIPLNVILRETGVVKFIVDWFITRNIVKGRPYMFFTMFYLAALVIGLFFQSVTLAVIFCGLAQQICTQIGYEKGSSFYNTLIVGILWISVLVNGATPISHAVPVILMNLLKTSTGIEITFSQWMMVGIPAAFLLVGVMLLCIRFIWKPDTALYKNYDVDKMQSQRQPMKLEGKISFVLFVVVVLMWILPDLLPGAAFLQTIKGLGMSIPAILALVFMCIVKVGDKPIANYNKILAAIPMHVIIFTGFVTIFGSIVGYESTGITVWLQNIFEPVTSNLPSLALVIIGIIGVYVVTSFISNTVSITIFYTVTVAVMLGTGMNVIPYVILLGIVGNLGALFPSASPNAGYFYGNFFEVKDVFKYNLTFMCTSLIVLLAVIYPLAVLIL